MSHPFDRYAPFTDLAALNEWTAKPLRKSLRVNTLKITVESFRAWAKEKNWQIESVPWCKEGFFVDRENRDEALGKDLLHLLGGFYMQEAASQLPVALLDPQPYDRVLDMSAAPGSKTTQIAARMALPLHPEGGGARGGGSNVRGILIANDVQEKRLWSLISNLQRCGVTNAAVTRKVGQWFAGNMTEFFDRVLCDAPCTAQGTARKDSDALEYCSMDNIGKMARLQRELLESAVHACKVGGRIVYSTCTLTPEENEDVVLSILNKFSDQLVIVDPRDALHRQWLPDTAIEDSEKVQYQLRQDRDYALPDSPYPLIRLWPQTYDTEGFFCAVFEKRAPTRERQMRKEVMPHQWSLLPNARRKLVADRLEDWFGTSFLREDELLFEMKDQLYLLPEDFLKFPLLVNPYMGGIPFGKSTSHGLTRLSHEMTSLRGHEATKQILRVTDEQRKDLFKGSNLELSPEGFDDGDLLFSLDAPAIGHDLVFGRGMLKNGIILNRLPRDMVRMFS